MSEAPAPSPAPAPVPAPAPSPAPAPAAWHGLTDATEAAYVTNKGWASPQDVIKSYQGAEKLIGRDPSTLIPMPRLDDPAGFRQVMQKLGLPETPDKYDLGKPAAGEPGWDEAYTGWAKGAFHKIGLPNDMAKALTAEHNAHIKSVMDQQAQDYTAKVTAEKTALLREWGGGHERMMNAAQTAAKSLGFTPEMIDSMEAAVGYAATMKHFAQLGQKLGEDKFVTGTGQPRIGDSLTPDEAKQQIEAMKIDPVMTAALKDNQHPGHKAAKEKQTRLFNIAYPG